MEMQLGGAHTIVANAKGEEQKFVMEKSWAQCNIHVGVTCGLAQSN